MTGLGRHKKEAIKLTAVRSASALIIKVISYPANVLIAAILGPAMLGAVKILGLIRTYSGYNHLGLFNVISRQVPIAEGAGDKSEIKSIEDNIYSATTVSLMFVLIVVWVLYFSGVTFKGHLDLFRLFVISATLFFLQVDSYLHCYMKAHGHFTLITKRNIFLSALTPFLTLILVWVLKVDGALLAQLSVTALGVIMYCYGVKVRRPRWNLELGKLAEYLSIGIKVFVNKILNGLFSAIDTTVIAVMMLPDKVGLYAFAWGVVLGVTMILDMFELMMHRHMLAARGKHGLDAGCSFLAKYLGNPTVGLILVASIFSACLFFGFSAVIRLFLLKYEGSLSCLYILSAGQIFYALSRVPSSCFNIIDWLGRRMVIVSSCLGLNAILDIVAIRMGYGIEGVALASAGCMGVYAITLVVMIRKKVAGSIVEPLLFLSKIVGVSIVAYGYIYYLDGFEIIAYSHYSKGLVRVVLGLGDAALKLLLVSLILSLSYFALFFKQKLHKEFCDGVLFLAGEILSKLRGNNGVSQ